MDDQIENALCKYRWTKTSDITCDSIGLYPSYAPNSPILLSWNEKDLAYFSENLRLVCGDYHGQLVLEGKVYPVEEFSIRSYTFEVDLFIKEPEEMPASQSELDESRQEQNSETSPSHTYKEFCTLENPEPYTTSSLDLGNLDLKVLSDSEELERHNMSEDDALINDVQDKLLSSSVKLVNDISLTNMKRDSPIGNDDAGKFSEYNFQSSNSSDIFEKHLSSPEQITPHSAAYVKSLSQTLDHAGAGMEMVEDVVRPSSRPSSRGSSGSEIRVEARDSFHGSRPPSIGADFTHGSRQSSLKHAHSMDAIYKPQSKESGRFSPDSLRNNDPLKGDSSRHTPTKEHVPERLRSSASPAHLIQMTSPKEGNSPVLGSILSSPRMIAQREFIGENIHATKGKIAENGEIIFTGSSLSGRPPSHPGSRSGSMHPSRTDSLNSLISDQELAQLFERSRPSSATSLPPGTTSVGAPVMKGSERPTHVHNWATQSQVQTFSSPGEFLSFKSDSENMRDAHGRSGASSRISTHSSSRTVTPVPADGGVREVTNDRIQELETSITNLRKLLSSREAEVHSLTFQLVDLKDINRSLREELDHRGRRHTPVSSLQDSFEYKQLQSEKEILASEVVTLRDELQRLNKGQAPSAGRSLNGSGIIDYSPNSPVVLQRKIVDLEAHVRDLQEVTEATNSSLRQAEKKMRLLQDENRDLKSRANNITDIQSQGDHTLRVELRTLREDIHNLKERNYQLTEENMRLIDEQKSGSKDISGHSSSSGSRLSSFRSDATVPRNSSGLTSTAYRYETAPVNHEASERSRAISSSPAVSKKVSHEDLAPREMRQSALNLDPRTQVSHLLQYQNSSESYGPRYQPRIDSTGSKSTESLRKDLHESLRKDLYDSDRSKPDGEVSEKLHFDKYGKILPSYEKKLYEDKTRDGGSYLDKHTLYKPRLPRESAEIWPKERFDVRDKCETYRHIKEGMQDSDTRVSSLDRIPSSGTAISSRDIFFNLQQKRAKRWITQDNKYLSGNLDSQSYRSPRTNVDSLGDDSDTATDILIGQDVSSRGLVQRRRTSLGSDGSPSSLSDVEDPTDTLLRRRSKSTDAKKGHSQPLSTLHRSESASRLPSSNEQVPKSVGFRSVIPAPLVTQHNKGEMTNKNITALMNSSLTQGLRPFAPRSPADIRTDDVVKFSRLGGKLTQGVVKYVGRLPGQSEAYLGVELDKDEGKHDGTFEGIRYFKCKPNKGVFVAFNKIVMAWAP